MKILTYKYGPYKLKDKADRAGITIKNKTEKYMVVDSISVRKIQGNNNCVDVIISMPDPKMVEVVEKI